MRFFILLEVITFLFFSCTSKYGKDQTIVINEIKEQEIQLSDVVSQIKILPLDTEADESLIGHIKDICRVDEIIYILDDITQSILAFNINTGKFIKRVYGVGQGPNEYINPISLSSYADNVYLLDISTQRIIRYDKQLNPMETIRLSFTSSDFIAAIDGFYLYNISSTNLKKVVQVNKNGKVLNTYISASKNISTSGFIEFTSKHFTSANNGNIYFIESMTNKLFCINNEMSHTIDFGKDNIPADFDINNMKLVDDMPYAFLVDFFSLNDYNIISFFKEKKRYYSFLELSTEKQQTGIVRDRKYGIPFFPRWKLNNTLIGTCNYHDMEENFDSIKSFFVTDIDKDNIDDEMSFLLLFDISLEHTFSESITGDP
jgi:hypothetical protein